MTWTVRVHPDAEGELDALPLAERIAVATAMEKLHAVGPGLTFPHSSNIQTAENLRELRPRQGHCRWRAFYRKIGDTFVVAAIGPEAGVDPKGFRQSVKIAEKRLDELEED